jgi:hypothetical protein
VKNLCFAVQLSLDYSQVSLCDTVKALTLETIDFVLEFVVVAFSGAILFTYCLMI